METETQTKYETLKLENQLCFPLYACAKEVVRQYKPYLDKIGLTYTQYITMMVMWEHRQLLVKEVGEYLFLDSGTMTPVLKKLEEKGFIQRHRSEEDERNIVVTLTREGEKLKEEAVDIPPKIGACIRLEPQEAMNLYQLLYKVLNQLG